MLPNACETKLVMTMNARSLHNFFRLRCCRRAQWEIRALAEEMLRLVLPVAPICLARRGPACLEGLAQRGGCAAARLPRCGQNEACGRRASMSKGKLIVLEGLDGSGKATQAKLLAEHLEREGVPVRKITFPDYESQASALVRMYLAGEFGAKPEDVNAYAASSFCGGPLRQL